MNQQPLSTLFYNKLGTILKEKIMCRASEQENKGILPKEQMFQALRYSSYSRELEHKDSNGLGSDSIQCGLAGKSDLSSLLSYQWTN